MAELKKYLEGSLNKEVHTTQYGGSETDSLIITVDNDTKTISGEVKWINFLGETPNTAYPGHKGASNYQKILELTEQLDDEIKRSVYLDNELKLKVTTLTSQLTEMLTQVNAKFKAQQTAIDRVNEKLNSNTNTLTELIQTIKVDLEKAINELENNLTATIQEEASRSITKDEEHDQLISNLRDLTNSLSKSLTSLIFKVAALERQDQAHTQLIEQLTQNLESDVTELRELIQLGDQENFAQIALLQKALEETIESYQESDEVIREELGNQLSELTDTLNTKVTELEEADQQINKGFNEALEVIELNYKEADKVLQSEFQTQLENTEESFNNSITEIRTTLASEEQNGLMSSEDKVAFEVMKTQLADLLYNPINIISFTNNHNIVEIGSTINEITLSWNINKTPTSLTLDDIDLSVTDRTRVLNDLNITTNHSFTLNAVDERNTVSTKTTSINFVNGIYYGAASIPDIYDSSFILNLHKTLRASKLTLFTVDARENEYIYYCLPIRLGNCTFTVGGFTGGFELINTIDFINASGYSESYYIYKSVNEGLGVTSIQVS